MNDQFSDDLSDNLHRSLAINGQQSRPQFDRWDTFIQQSRDEKGKVPSNKRNTENSRNWGPFDYQKFRDEKSKVLPKRRNTEISNPWGAPNFQQFLNDTPKRRNIENSTNVSIAIFHMSIAPSVCRANHCDTDNYQQSFVHGSEKGDGVSPMCMMAFMSSGSRGTVNNSNVFDHS